MRRCLFFILLVAVCVTYGSATNPTRPPKLPHKEIIHLDELNGNKLNKDKDFKKHDEDRKDALEKNDREFEDDEDDDEDLDFDGELPFHPVEGVEDPSLVDLIVRSRRPSCSNRKCMRWYRGWWGESCPGEHARAVNFCQKTGKWCCAQCRTRKWCTGLGGACMIRGRCPDDYTIKENGCTGKWICCVPPGK